MAIHQYIYNLYNKKYFIKMYTKNVINNITSLI